MVTMALLELVTGPLVLLPLAEGVAVAAAEAGVVRSSYPASVSQPTSNPVTH